MPSLSARLSSFERKKIDDLSKKWKLGNAETLRRLVVLGLGGTMEEADELNEEMRLRREAAEKVHGPRRKDRPMEEGASSYVVRVRLPSSWSSRVRKAKTPPGSAGLHFVLALGLERL